jgi:hypothetical protein
MKVLTKLVLIGIIAGAAVLVWQAGWHSPSPLPAAVALPPGLSARPAPASFQAVRFARPPNPTANALASLHSKLRFWQESEINDPDDEEGRARSLQEMLAMVTDENVAEIVQSLSAAEMNTPFGSGALHHWMQTDPVAASNWLASRPGATEEQTLTVAHDWVGKPEDLKQYLAQLPDTGWKQTFLQDVSMESLFKDPQQAVNLAQQMNPGDAQTNLLRAVACGWVGADPNAALDWVAGVKDPALREQLVASAVQAYALSDPAQAAAWLVQEVKSDAVIKDAALNILNTWVATDPAAAASWAAQFPEGSIKSAAVEIVSNHWLQTDPKAAAAWLQELSGGPAAAPSSSF